LTVDAKVALVTGITGQDGGYLAPLLQEKGYEVYGIVRAQSLLKTEQLRREFPYVKVIEADLVDPESMRHAVEQSDPDEFYNLAAISNVGYSFSNPVLTLDITAKGVLNCLEAIRVTGRTNKTKFYQASTSELYGGVGYNRPASGYDENSTFHPRSPYGVAKLYGHWISKNYRESYGIFASCGILFNHESERRGVEFVTRKITQAVARIHLGLQDTLELGDLRPKRDWGYAGDYVRGMWQMMQHNEPDDFVLASGAMHSIEDFVTLAFEEVGIGDWSPYVKHSLTLVRPAEVDVVLGNPAKAESVLGWKRELDLRAIVRRMVQHDLAEQRAFAL
jgi:GDPmannose 4,6-dehydratase